MLKMKRHELINRIIEEVSLPDKRARLKQNKRSIRQSFSRQQLLELFLYIVSTKKIIKDLRQKAADHGNA